MLTLLPKWYYHSNIDAKSISGREVGKIVSQLVIAATKISPWNLHHAHLELVLFHIIAACLIILFATPWYFWKRQKYITLQSCTLLLCHDHTDWGHHLKYFWLLYIQSLPPYHSFALFHRLLGSMLLLMCLWISWCWKCWGVCLRQWMSHLNERCYFLWAVSSQGWQTLQRLSSKLTSNVSISC